MTTKTNPNQQLASGWTFSMTDAQRWEWKCCDPSGNVLKRCSRTFTTLVECLQDATTHGYVPDRTDC